MNDLNRKRIQRARTSISNLEASLDAERMTPGQFKDAWSNAACTLVGGDDPQAMYGYLAGEIESAIKAFEIRDKNKLVFYKLFGEAVNQLAGKVYRENFMPNVLPEPEQNMFPNQEAWQAYEQERDSKGIEEKILFYEHFLRQPEPRQRRR